ncbi:MAG: hypothetical protein ACJ746_10760 [Bryobacteraceae bacterium]
MIPNLTARLRHFARISPVLTYIVVGAATYYLLFVLPYAFPPPSRPLILSASYVFGFNNRIGILGLISVTVFLAFSQTKLTSGFVRNLRVKNAHRIDPVLLGFLALASLWYLALTLTIYFVVAKTNGFYRFDWESSHFMWHARMIYEYGARPYLDFVTSYGPALVYLPAWCYVALRPLGISLEGSYYVLHYFLNVVGLVGLLYFIDSFAIEPKYKRISFLLVALSGFSLPMGLSGLLIRYLLPYVGLLCVHTANVQKNNNRIQWRVLAAASASSAAAIAISPEIAIACLAAITIYGLGLLPSGWRTAVQIFVAEVFVIGLAVLSIPGNYFRGVISFSRGGANFPIEPVVHIVFYTFVVLICIPRLLAWRLLESGADASFVCALGGASLAMIPPALGRCDASHVFLNGFGLFTVGFALFARSGVRRFYAYSLAYASVVILFFQLSNVRTYGISRSLVQASINRVSTGFRKLLMSSPSIPSETGPPSQSGTAPTETGRRENVYARFDEYGALGLPYGSYGYEKWLQQYLWNKKRVLPERYMGALDVYSGEQLQERLSELATMGTIVIQKNFLKLYEDRDPCKEQQEYLSHNFLATSARPCVHKAVDANIEIAKFIDRHYRQEEQIGDYLIMKRTR